MRSHRENAVFKSPGLLSMKRCNALKQNSSVVSVLENVKNTVPPSSLLLAETVSPLTLTLNTGSLWCCVLHYDY